MLQWCGVLQRVRIDNKSKELADLEILTVRKMASKCAFFKLLGWCLALMTCGQISLTSAQIQKRQYNDQTYQAYFDNQHIQTGFQPIWYPPHAVSGATPSRFPCKQLCFWRTRHNYSNNNVSFCALSSAGLFCTISEVKLFTIFVKVPKLNDFLNYSFTTFWRFHHPSIFLVA